MNGIIENATGYLLKAGYCDFSGDAGYNSAIHTIKIDVPETAHCKGDDNWPEMHQWTPAGWVLTSQQILPVVQAALVEKLRIELNNYVTSRYSDGAKQSLLGAWIEAVQKGYVNRSALIQSVWNWIRTILGYYGGKMGAIRTASTVAAANAVTWSFDQFTATDPNVTIMAALSITN